MSDFSQLFLKKPCPGANCKNELWFGRGDFANCPDKSRGKIHSRRGLRFSPFFINGRNRAIRPGWLRSFKRKYISETHRATVGEGYIPPEVYGFGKCLFVWKRSCLRKTGKACHSPTASVEGAAFPSALSREAERLPYGAMGIAEDHRQCHGQTPLHR